MQYARQSTTITFVEDERKVRHDGFGRRKINLIPKPVVVRRSRSPGRRCMDFSYTTLPTDRRLVAHDGFGRRKINSNLHGRRMSGEHGRRSTDRDYTELPLKRVLYYVAAVLPIDDGVKIYIVGGGYGNWTADIKKAASYQTKDAAERALRLSDTRVHCFVEPGL